jgi:hypothetical protein
MPMLTNTLVVIALVLSTVRAFAAPAEEKKPAGDSKAVLAAMSKYSEPGAAHKVLKSLEGVWDTSATVWLAAGGAGETAKGRAEFWANHGDRFMIEEFTGQLLGKPVTFHVILGYDNAKKKYVASLINSVSTEIRTREGTADASGKVITFTGTTFDAIAGRNHAERAVYKLESDKKLTVEVFETPPGGKEFKKMEVSYSRK